MPTGRAAPSERRAHARPLKGKALREAGKPDYWLGMVQSLGTTWIQV